MITEEQVRQELADNYQTFAETCLHIKHKVTTNLSPFIFNKAQLYLHNECERQRKERGFVRVIELKGRQQGISTYVAGRAYHNVTQNTGTNAFILSHLSSSTDELFNMVKVFNENAPKLFTPETTSNNSRIMRFNAINSKFSIGTAGNAEIGRGSNYQFFHGSEVGFWENAEKISAGIMNAILTNGIGTEMHLESTANGLGNYYHDQWLSAVEGHSNFVPVFIPWFWQDEYAVKALPKDFERTKHEEELVHEFKINDYQLMWRRIKIAENAKKGGKGEVLFKQEYPFHPQEAFQMTGNKGLIESEDVMRARRNVSAQANGAVVMGIDPSLGGDKFAISVRQGRVHLATHWKQGEEIRHFNARISYCINMINQYNPHTVFIDAGYGADLVDVLRDRVECNIESVPFGGSATRDDLYNNKKAEMYGEMSKWISNPTEPVKIIDDDMLHSHLCASLYMFDNLNRLQMQKKDKVRKLIGVSPDLSDSLALTFAEPVVLYEHYHSRPVEIIGRI